MFILNINILYQYKIQFSVSIYLFIFLINTFIQQEWDKLLKHDSKAFFLVKTTIIIIYILIELYVKVSNLKYYRN